MWVRCKCGRRRIPRKKTQVDEIEHDDAVMRSYKCVCGVVIWTRESIYSSDAPTTSLVSRFGSGRTTNGLTKSKK